MTHTSFANGHFVNVNVFCHCFVILNPFCDGIFAASNCLILEVSFVYSVAYCDWISHLRQWNWQKIAKQSCSVVVTSVIYIQNCLWVFYWLTLFYGLFRKCTSFFFLMYFVYLFPHSSLQVGKDFFFFFLLAFVFVVYPSNPFFSAICLCFFSPYVFCFLHFFLFLSFFFPLLFFPPLFTDPFFILTFHILHGFVPDCMLHSLYYHLQSISFVFFLPPTLSSLIFFTLSFSRSCKIFKLLPLILISF